MTVFGADPTWTYDTNAYPFSLAEARAGRDLPNVQVMYTTDTGIHPGLEFVATLFDARSTNEARGFWKEHGPETVYTRSVMLDDVPSADRDKALRFARHEMTEQRRGESWSVVCIGPIQSAGDHEDCDDLAVWVAWCNKVLELRIGIDYIMYRSDESDAVLRSMVDSIQSNAGC